MKYWSKDEFVLRKINKTSRRIIYQQAKLIAKINLAIASLSFFLILFSAITYWQAQQSIKVKIAYTSGATSDIVLTKKQYEILVGLREKGKI